MPKNREGRIKERTNRVIWMEDPVRSRTRRRRVNRRAY